MNQDVRRAHVLKSLKALRRRIDRMEGLRPQLYSQMKTLYEEGFRAELTPAEMAREMRPKGDHVHLAETIRQHLRDEGLVRPRKKRRKSPASRA